MIFYSTISAFFSALFEHTKQQQLLCQRACNASALCRDEHHKASSSCLPSLQLQPCPLPLPPACPAVPPKMIHTPAQATTELTSTCRELDGGSSVAAGARGKRDPSSRLLLPLFLKVPRSRLSQSRAQVGNCREPPGQNSEIKAHGLYPTARAQHSLDHPGGDLEDSLPLGGTPFLLHRLFLILLAKLLQNITKEMVTIGEKSFSLDYLIVFFFFFFFLFALFSEKPSVHSCSHRRVLQSEGKKARKHFHSATLQQFDGAAAKKSHL